MDDKKNSDDKQNTPASCMPELSADSLTYNNYLKVLELKQLQVCQSNPPHHDEPLFIVIHQAYELWFKLILHEIDAIFELLKQNNLRRSTTYMRRVNAIMKLLVQQIHILETMTPNDFLGFRYNLTPASGFGSTQFREIEFSAGLKDASILEYFQHDPAHAILKQRYEHPDLKEEFYALLRRRGFMLPEPTAETTPEQALILEDQRLHELGKVYVQEEAYSDVYDFSEALVEFDELLFLWRSHHVIVVERMIGFKRGTGGSEGVGYLQSTLNKRCFSDLWKLRTYLEQPQGLGLEAGREKVQDKKSSAGAKSGCPFS